MRSSCGVRAARIFSSEAELDPTVARAQGRQIGEARRGDLKRLAHGIGDGGRRYFVRHS